MRYWQPLSLVLVVLFVGCQPLTPPAGEGGTVPLAPTARTQTPTAVEEETDGTATPAAQEEVDPLANTQWQLISFGISEPELPDMGEVAITLAFDAEGQVSGSTGCNSFGGSYQVAENAIIFSEVISTLRACIDDAVMEREQRYLQALGATVEFERMTDQLVITTETGDTLTFTRLEGGAVDGTPTAEAPEA